MCIFSCIDSDNSALIDRIPGLKSMAKPQFLSGDKAAIDAFLDRFDVSHQYPATSGCADRQ
jgi:hypothetical protein